MSNYRPGILNQCGVCGEDFASVEAFDTHRVGTHVPLNRHCLSVAELKSGGFRLNARGRWEITARADRARRTFGRTAGGAS